MYIVVFFLLVWSICYIVLSEARCKPISDRHDTNLVYLLETNKVHREINKKFLKYYYEATNKEMIQPIYPLRNCSAILMKTMEDVKILRYVIHLYVDDFYQTNYNTVIDNGLRWAGDIGITSYRRVCKSNDSFERDDKDTCIDFVEEQKHAKLVSEEILSPNVYTSQEFNKLKLLMNSVKYFDILNANVPQTDIETIENIIVICGPVTQLENFDDTVTYSDKIIKISFSYDCRLRKGVVAILAPNPETIEGTSIPVIFYKEPYVRTDVSAFRNSIIRYRSVKYLGQAFMEFIKEMKLKRVAILSDDSDESVAFEKELTTLFNGEGISYTVVSTLSVNDSCCDFTDAFDSLKKAEVKIAVANVDQKNADMMIQQLNNHKIYYSKIVWFARDWSHDTTTKAIKRIKSIISVRSKRTPLKTYLQAVVNTMHIFYNNTYNDEYTLDYNDEFTLDYNNRKYFVHHLREELKLEDETEIDVVLSRSGKESTVMNFKRGRSTVLAHLPKLNDRNSDCTIKSANFYKPCDDHNLVFIMLVIAVFALTVLGIVYFFSAPNTIYSRMN